MFKLLLLLLFLGFFIIIYFTKLDFVKTHYESFEKLVQSNDLSKGWININIPKSSTNIVEYHNLDTNEIWISFEHLSIDSLLDTCNRIEIFDTHILPVRYPSEKWKNDLLKNLSQKQVYKCDTTSYIVIKNENNHFQSVFYRVN